MHRQRAKINFASVKEHIFDGHVEMESARLNGHQFKVFVEMGMVKHIEFSNICWYFRYKEVPPTSSKVKVFAEDGVTHLAKRFCKAASPRS